MKNTELRYGWLAQWLHWGIAALVVLQFILINLAETAEHGGRPVAALAILANHKSIGLTILTLALIRLLWRLYSPPPALKITTPPWQRRASQISHGLLYTLLFTLPLSGWLLSSSAGYSVSWFNLFPLPDLVPNRESLESLFEGLHETLATVLFVLALIHLLAALRHAFVLRDDVVRRMTSKSSLIGFFVVIGAGYGLLGNPLNGSSVDTADLHPEANHAQEKTQEPATQGLATASDSPTATAANSPSLWKIDHEASHIQFKAEQAGAPFEGRWQDWQASIQFDPLDLANSSAEVSIVIASIQTGDNERDETIQSPEWFDREHYPTVRFKSQNFTESAIGQYRSEAVLTIKDQPYPVIFNFNVQRQQDRLRLQGHSVLDRLALKLGTGDWTDTTWIGQTVRVEVVIVAFNQPGP